MGRMGDTFDTVTRTLRDTPMNMRAVRDVPVNLKNKGKGNRDGVNDVDKYTDNGTNAAKAERIRDNYRNGKDAETKVPGDQNHTRIDAPSGKAEYRIPDRLDVPGGVIGDVKNVNRQGLTSQIRDFISFQKDKGLDFHLYVRAAGADGTGGTHISAPLQALIDGPANRIFLHRVDFSA